MMAFADYAQEQEMEIEALQAILMDDIEGFLLILFFVLFFSIFQFKLI